MAVGNNRLIFTSDLKNKAMTNLQKSKYNAVIETVAFPSLTFYSVTYSYREDGITKTDAKDFYTYEEAKQFFNSINA